jgi:alpha-ketoglutarate-dependent taurine dioxygenase
LVNDISGGQPEGTSIADSAYGIEGLPLHTDMTYHRDPPGLQIFTMVQPAGEGGGESIFCDGFAAAEHLRKMNPEAFATLSETTRRYRCVDEETGWHLEASGPVISVHNGTVVGIRHNDLDRLTDLPPPEATGEEIDKFYDRLQAAHEAWDSILCQDDFRLVVALQPGETMVVANQVSVVQCHALHAVVRLRRIFICQHGMIPSISLNSFFASVVFMDGIASVRAPSCHDPSWGAMLARTN